VASSALRPSTTAGGDDRSLEDIERELARDDMSAMEMRIDNVRVYGAKPERRPDVEHTLQRELSQKQHSSSLDNQEAMRVLEGGNAGTENLAREQLAVQDEMLEPPKDPLGALPRELKSGVTRTEFDQIDQNLTQTLDVQREEKIKLSEHFAKIFATIGKIAALLTAQPELFALIDIATGLATMAIKNSVAGEAYDPADDAKALLIDAAVDTAMVGFGKVAELRKAAKIGQEVAEVGEVTAVKALEEGATTEAKEEIVTEGANEAASEAKALEVRHPPFRKVSSVRHLLASRRPMSQANSARVTQPSRKERSQGCNPRRRGAEGADGCFDPRDRSSD
jgi:hypothetical protein